MSQIDLSKNLLSAKSRYYTLKNNPVRPGNFPTVWLRKKIYPVGPGRLPTMHWGKKLLSNVHQSCT